jgi:hypothetical protein
MSSVKSISVKDVADLIERLANTYGFDYDTEFQKFIADFTPSPPAAVDKHKTMHAVMRIVNESAEEMRRIRRKHV